MSSINLELFKKLVELPGVSGHEFLISEFIQNYCKRLSDEVYVDRLGNVAAVFKGSSAQPRKIMFTSHIDEVGLVVRRIDSNGYIRVVRVGGVDSRAFISREVRIVTKTGKEINGIVGIKSHHLMMTPEERDKVPSWNEIYIDVGASDAREVRDMGVDVGDQITYYPNLRVLNNKLISTKTIDNRALNYILLKTMEAVSREKLHNTIIFAFTVQEELNLKGSIPLARALKPDYIVNLDIVPATDTPDTLQEASEVKLGHGPTLYMYTFHGRGSLAGHVAHLTLRDFIEKIAKDHSIKLQKAAMLGVVTEVSYLYLQDGIPSIDIGLPCRYTHYPNELASISDILELENLVQLIAMESGKLE